MDSEHIQWSINQDYHERRLELQHRAHSPQAVKERTTAKNKNLKYYSGIWCKENWTAF
jgi:hypothetical protein